jgi:hypothetical protein
VKKRNILVRSEDLTAAIMKAAVFWDAVLSGRGLLKFPTEVLGPSSGLNFKPSKQASKHTSFPPHYTA